MKLLVAISSRLAPTFVTVTGRRPCTYGPFWTHRSLRRWQNEFEEMQLGTDVTPVTSRWQPRRRSHTQDAATRRTLRL